MPDFDLDKAAAANHRAESTHSSLDKITFEMIADDVVKTGALLQSLLPVTKDNWPEFQLACARMRGVCFNVFRLTHATFPYAGSRSAEVKPAVKKAASIDDIFGAL